MYLHIPPMSKPTTGCLVSVQYVVIAYPTYNKTVEVLNQEDVSKGKTMIRADVIMMMTTDNII